MYASDIDVNTTKHTIYVILQSFYLELFIQLDQKFKFKADSSENCRLGEDPEDLESDSSENCRLGEDPEDLESGINHLDNKN